MKHIKQLLEKNPKIGEVNTSAGDFQAHKTLRTMAAIIGAPAVRQATIKVPAEQITSRIETVSGRLAPHLASWIMEEDIDTVISPELLTTELIHRVAGRVVMKAAAHAANVTGRKIDVLTGHGAVLIPGDWRVESDLGNTSTFDGPATTYSRHQVHPGIISSESIEWFFGLPSEE